jgi:hypothetical protein
MSKKDKPAEEPEVTSCLTVDHCGHHCHCHCHCHSHWHGPYYNYSPYPYYTTVGTSYQTLGNISWTTIA